MIAQRPKEPNPLTNLFSSVRFPFAGSQLVTSCTFARLPLLTLVVHNQKALADSGAGGRFDLQPFALITPS
jgi:hypothetical protein